MSSLSSKITTLEVNSPASHPPPPQAGFTEAPAEPWKGNTSSPEAAMSKVGESSMSLPASILVYFLLLPLTLIHAAILLTAGPKSCPAAAEWEDSASLFGYSPTVFVRSEKEFIEVIGASYRQWQKRSLHMHGFNLLFRWYGAKLKTLTHPYWSLPCHFRFCNDTSAGVQVKTELTMETP